MKLNQSEKRLLKVAYYSFFPNNNVRDARTKHARSLKQTKLVPARHARKTTRSNNNYENRPKKIPCYAGVSKK